LVSFSARRRWLAAAGCVVVLLAGTACGTANPVAGDINDSGDPATPAATTESPVPAQSPTSGSGPPALPAIAKQDSPAGVEAFIAHYFEVLNYGIDSSDWEPLKQLADPDCDACKLLPVPAGRGKIDGGHWKPGKVSVFIDRDPMLAAAKVPMSSAAGTLTAPNASPTPMPAGNWVYQVNLVRKDDSWHVLELNLIDS
jgi:hypothetical protein